MASSVSISTATPRPPPPLTGIPSSMSFDTQRGDLPIMSAQVFFVTVIPISKKGLLFECTNKPLSFLMSSNANA
ncbi:hypothetical protein [Vibrio phage VP882]|uniref:Uncharacterized protein n=1 Tax=Vibrio phage VP882 TaxID=2913982 RepID=A2I2W3_9CAUD|nr:hypothetical protein VPVV882_gp01 [Vibrio phage VP882]ABM73377.1 hypothetical protein [Vibrio phage VP882]TOE71966.1 hypothetical protein CGJ36_22680 [Vibrio parahaemolyticus]